MVLYAQVFDATVIGKSKVLGILAGQEQRFVDRFADCPIRVNE